MAVDGLLYTVVVLLVEIPNDPSSVDIEKICLICPLTKMNYRAFIF